MGLTENLEELERRNRAAELGGGEDRAEHVARMARASTATKPAGAAK